MCGMKQGIIFFIICIAVMLIWIGKPEKPDLSQETQETYEENRINDPCETGTPHWSFNC